MRMLHLLSGIITTNLKECDAFSGKYLLHDHLTIDLTLGVSGVGFSDHLDALCANAKEHHEDPLSHTHIYGVEGGFKPHIPDGHWL